MENCILHTYHPSFTLCWWLLVHWGHFGRMHTNVIDWTTEMVLNLDEVPHLRIFLDCAIPYKGWISSKFFNPRVNQSTHQCSCEETWRMDGKWYQLLTQLRFITLNCDMCVPWWVLVHCGPKFPSVENSLSLTVTTCRKHIFHSLLRPINSAQQFHITSFWPHL